MKQEMQILGQLDSPLGQALLAGDLEQAEQLLQEKGRLSWQETAQYAPMAFHRPPWLLRRILDLGPRETVFCAGTFPRPGGGWRIRLCGTLLTAAAALDDLAAVEELLRRGYATRAYTHYQYYTGLDQWSEEMVEWHRAASCECYSLGNVWMVPWDCDSQSTERFHYGPQSDCTPLAVAIWCGAVQCVERLLPEQFEQLALVERNVLSWGPLLGDEARNQAVVELVERKYGQKLEQLLDPGEFRNRESPWFLPCLARHPEWFSEKTAQQFVQWAMDRKTESSWAWEALPLIPPQLLSQVVLEQLSECRRANTPDNPLWTVLNHPKVRVTVDRCAVPRETGKAAVLDILECMNITGQPPENGLSGLAAAVLNTMLDCLRSKADIDMQCRARLLHGERAAVLLEAEDPEMIKAYLDWKTALEGVPYADADLVLTVLGLRKECRYEL